MQGGKFIVLYAELCYFKNHCQIDHTPALKPEMTIYCNITNMYIIVCW